MLKFVSFPLTHPVALPVPIQVSSIENMASPSPQFLSSTATSGENETVIDQMDVNMFYGNKCQSKNGETEKNTTDNIILNDTEDCFLTPTSEQRRSQKKQKKKPSKPSSRSGLQEVVPSLRRSKRQTTFKQ